MLSPEYYEGCADDIVKLYEQLEDDIISDVSRRIIKTGKVTESAKHHMQDSLNYANDVVKRKQAKMRDFINQTGQHRDYFREQNYGRVAYPKNSTNDLTFTKNNGIIEREESIPECLKSKSKLSPTISSNSSLAVIGTNPNYYSGDERYSVNCQRCVAAYEARRRGYDVTAKPASLDSEPIKQMEGENGWSNVYKGGKDDILTIFGSTSTENKENICNVMSGYGNGARAVVRVQWQDGRGHVFIAEQVDNKTKFIDPQTGDINVESYFDDDLIKTDKTRLLRIDDKEFTELIEECVE